MKVHHRISIALALLTLCAGTAMATPLTIQASGLPTYLNNQAYQGSFDAAALLPKKFTVNSLQFSFILMDDGDSVAYATGPSVVSSPVSTRQTVDGKTIKETITRTITTHRTGVGEKESVNLSFGGLSFAGATAATTTSTSDKSQVSGTSQVLYVNKANESIACTSTQWSKSPSACQQIIRTAVTNYDNSTSTTDYSGQIELDGSLMSDTALISAILLNRKLDFSLGVLGDLNLLSASLEIDFSPVAADVPEPAELALFGVTLLAALAVHRSRRA